MAAAALACRSGRGCVGMVAWTQIVLISAPLRQRSADQAAFVMPSHRCVGPFHEELSCVLGTDRAGLHTAAFGDRRSQHGR